MKPFTLVTPIAVLTLVLPATDSSVRAAQETRATVSPDGRVAIETDDAVALAGAVIESTLRGVGGLLEAMRGDGRAVASSSTADPGVDSFDGEVEVDPGRGLYRLTLGDGSRLSFDSSTGTFELEGDGAQVGADLIETSLRGVGAMIRTLPVGARALEVGSLAPQAGHLGTGLLLGMSATERDAVVELWRRVGLSDHEIARRLDRLGAADATLRESMADLDRSMADLDAEMAKLDERSTTDGSVAPSDSRRRAGAVSRDDLTALTRSLPVSCTTNGHLEIVRRRIEAVEFGVLLTGNCTASIRESVIDAAGHAVRATGNVELEIVDSELRGGGAALHLTGNARIKLRDSTIAGGVLRTGNARLTDLGGNVFEDDPTR